MLGDDNQNESILANVGEPDKGFLISEDWCRRHPVVLDA
jgi:hypothetical protein